jgi:hypothetical protein
MEKYYNHKTGNNTGADTSAPGNNNDDISDNSKQEIQSSDEVDGSSYSRNSLIDL